MTTRRTKPRRFKVQRAVDLIARDYSNRPFWLGTIWRQEAQADRQVVAEQLLLKLKHDRPTSEFRIAEEWPIGSEPRPIFRTKIKPGRLGTDARGSDRRVSDA